MLGKGAKEFGTQREILHELRRQFHEIPIYIGAAERGIVRIGENTVQGVSELVQESLQLVECEQRGARRGGFAEVHRHTHVGTTRLALQRDARLAIGRHPSATLFRRAGEEIRIEHSEETTVGIKDFIGLDFLVIDGDFGILLEGNSI